MSETNLDYIESKSTLEIADHENENAAFIITELTDLLNDERTYQDVSIVTEIIKTVRLLIKQGGCRRKIIFVHSNVSKLHNLTSNNF